MGFRPLISSAKSPVRTRPYYGTNSLPLKIRSFAPKFNWAGRLQPVGCKTGDRKEPDRNLASDCRPFTTIFGLCKEPEIEPARGTQVLQQNQQGPGAGKKCGHDKRVR